MIYIKYNSLNSFTFFNLIFIPFFSGFMFFSESGLSGFRNFTVQVFQGPGFSGSRFFRVQVFKIQLFQITGQGFALRVQVQVSEVVVFNSVKSQMFKQGYKHRYHCLNIEYTENGRLLFSRDYTAKYEMVFVLRKKNSSSQKLYFEAN